MTAYILPVSSTVLPRGLSLNQFLQTVLVGISGLAGPLVRPKWQKQPPKNPDVDVNWIGFGVDVASPDANAYVGVNEDDQTVMQRHEVLDIGCSFYGPDANALAGIMRDGFQAPPNREALTLANMGLVETGQIRSLPELVNEQWLNRVVMNILIRREVQRIYPIPTLVSASGRIHTVLGDEEYLLDWETEN